MRRFEGASAIDEIVRDLDLQEDHSPNDITWEKCPGEDGSGCKYKGYLVVRGNRMSGSEFLGCSKFPILHCCLHSPYLGP